MAKVKIHTIPKSCWELTGDYRAQLLFDKGTVNLTTKDLDVLAERIQVVRNEIKLKMTDRERAVREFGAFIIIEAECYYETNFGDGFWSDLNPEARMGYILRAKRNIDQRGPLL